MSRDNSQMTTTEALREVGLVGPGAALDDLDAELMTEDERNALLRALADFGTDERLAALDTLKGLIERAERDAKLLGGREFDEGRFAEAYGLLALLRAKEQER